MTVANSERIAVIPAAGMATRLRPLTAHTPKCLLKVGGKTLLDRALYALRTNGIKRVVIITGFMAEMIEQHVSRHHTDMEVHFVHNTRYQSTNNIYSLYLAKPFAAGHDILLLDSDILFDPEVIKRLLAATQSEALALERHSVGEEEIKVTVDDRGLVREISKTVNTAEAIGESVGFEKMSATYTTALYKELDRMILHEGLDNVFYERAFERLIAQGLSFSTVDITGLYAAELDTVEDFHNAAKRLPAHLL